MLGFLRKFLPYRRVPERDLSLNAIAESVQQINRNLDLVVHHLMSGPHEVAKRVERFMICTNIMRNSSVHLYAGELIYRVFDYEGNHEYYRGDIFRFNFGRCLRRTRNALPKEYIENLINDKMLMEYEYYLDLPVRVIGM